MAVAAAFCASASFEEESTDGRDEGEEDGDADDDAWGRSFALAALLLSAWNSKKPSRLASCAPKHDTPAR